jgi:hypothetical protein
MRRDEMRALIAQGKVLNGPFRLRRMADRIKVRDS